MADTTIPSLKPASTVVIFGPQALSFNHESFMNLRSQLHEARNKGLLDAICGLSGYWPALVKDVSVLQHVGGGTLLEELATAIQTGELSKLNFPLSSIQLSPLVVAAQLTQYVGFLKIGLPGLSETDKFPPVLMNGTEALGLCIGLLPAMAVNCASSLAELHTHGAAAVRLAMLVGALIDAEQASPESEGSATSFSVSWTNLKNSVALEEILGEVPEAYESVIVDKKRSTITSSKRAVPTLIERLKSKGMHVADVALSGRFHWSKHQTNAEKMVHFCESNPDFQLPAVEDLVLSHRTKGRYAPTERLHKIGLDLILTSKSDWLTLFSDTCSAARTTADAQILCIGPERCILPSISLNLGSRLIHISQLDLSTSSVPQKVFNARNITDVPDDHIAVIGMSCQVPGASDLSEFWEVLTSGQSQHVEVPASRFSMETPWRTTEKGRKWYGNFIDNYDTFDHKFFKKSPRETASMDPQHRIILQLAYQAVEQSGYFLASNRIMDKHIGCYIGIGNVDYDRNISCHPANAYSATGNLRSFVAGKVSHYFGWTGPSVSVDTACSSSTVAIHNACCAILHGECSAALAGGVNLLTNPDWFHNLAAASFLSPTGQCRPFDARGDGYCRGEGAGLVLLKKLSTALADGDQVFGVIAGSKVYQNLNCTPITVPNASSLSDLFTAVLQQAKLDPQDISVVEAHGTGTPVGDPAEYDGIRRVLGGSIRSRGRKLALSSVKGSVGHAEFASGVSALLKILLMLDAKAIPPQVSFSALSPGLKATPEDEIEIPTLLKPWDSNFRAALINNYGASGSNCCLVVTEAPAAASWNQSARPTSAKRFPFWFSGLNDQSLRAYVSRFRKTLQQLRMNTSKDWSAANLSFQVARQSNRSLPQALILSATSSDELDQKLAAFERGDTDLVSSQQPQNRPVILCFGGQVSTYVGLNRDVYTQVAALRDHLDKCDAVCISLGLDSIYPHIFQKAPIEDIVALQTALFALQFASAQVWLECGLKVAAVVGHSFGELTALCIAGAYTLEDALKVISGRARLIQKSWGADKGSMLAVEADPQIVNALLENSNQATRDSGTVTIACYNGPRTFTLAGPTKAIEFTERLAEVDPKFSGMRMKMLNVTNAFHSTLVDDLVDDLTRLGEDITFKTPSTRVERATEEAFTEAVDSSYFAKHMRNPVFFDHAVQRLAKDFPAAIWLEAGSNSTVATMASRALGNPSSSHFQSVHTTTDGSFQFLVDAMIKLWKEGVNVSFWAHHAKQMTEYSPIILPPYQFERSRHWMELRELPQPLPVTKSIAQAETPKGITIFRGYQDTGKRNARFEVNTELERFRQPVDANRVLNTAAVVPGMLQLQIVLDALDTLQPELKKLGYQPELRDMSQRKPLVPNSLECIYLDAEKTDAAGLVWKWKLSGTNSRGVTSIHTTGSIIWRPENDPEVLTNYQSLTRLSGRKRCLDLLRGSADEVLSGRSAYRAFEQIVHYGSILRCATKIVANEGESAGRVVRTYNEETWIDPILTESFCQVAGIYLNVMADIGEASESNIFVCDGIGKWLRNPQLESSALSGDWEVFAVHDRQSEAKYISDVFAFNTRDGSLFEAVLGISFRRISIDAMCKTLSTPEPGGTLTNGDSTPTTIPGQIDIADPSRMRPATVPEKKPETKETKKPPKSSRSYVASQTLEIVANLSGLEPDEIKHDSDLIEMGIDSLMAMELMREVEHAFNYALSVDQLLSLTDFKSLVDLIWLCLVDGDKDAGEVAFGMKEEEEDTTTRSDGFHSSIGNGKGHHTIQPTPAIKNIQHACTGHSTPSNEVDTKLPAPIVQDAFFGIKWATDDFIMKGNLSDYVKKVIPKSTEVCIAYILDAFEELGCPIRSAAPGQQLIPFEAPKHQKLLDLIYNQLLKDGARLVEINGSVITRTAVTAPHRPTETLLAELLHEEPVHATEHELIGLFGPRLADCLAGKEECVQIMFGTAAGREIATRFYAESPFTGVWIQQLEYFLENLFTKLPRNDEPLRILEVGAGTGGTTSKLVPMLGRLGVPVKYAMTDISGGLVAAGRKRFGKVYPFMEFEVLNIESEPAEKLVQSQHMILATNCVHATRDLSISLKNLRRMLRPDGFLMLLEMTQQVPWVDFVFGLIEGWWLFEDDRDYVLQPPQHWQKKLYAAGFGHVDWTDGQLPEASMQRLIIAHASEPRSEAPEPSPSPALPNVDKASTELVHRQKIADTYIETYSGDFCAPIPHPSMPSSSIQLPLRRHVLVTGATGSLGSHIAAYLTQLPDVESVLCFNRPSTEDGLERQRKSFEKRGLRLDPSSGAKLKVIPTDTSKPWLGLSAEKYHELTHSVTDIVHSAWPMSLTRPVRGYESQFKVFCNLVEFARQAADHRPAEFKFGFQFISSVAVVANYPQMTGAAAVPEQPMTVESVPATGYADAKLICEHILSKTLHVHRNRFHPMIVRIAQISGSTGNGYWNTSEYMPFLVKSSKMIRRLPDLSGTLSWTPVDVVAATLGELLVGSSNAASDQLIYHIDNPSRQSWKEMIGYLAEALEIPATGIVPYEEWVAQIKGAGGSSSKNPALQLIEFFELYFVPMSCGGLMLDTTCTKEFSQTLRTMGQVSRDLVMKYVDAWRASGFLK